MCAAQMQSQCSLCKKEIKIFDSEESALCPTCADKSEKLFDEEMRRMELLRLIRGADVELYDLKHPDSTAENNYCGQVILIKAGQGFEVKIFLKSGVLEWSTYLTDGAGFKSLDTRLDALIGNISLLIESWGGGPHYMDIFYVDKVLSVEGEL
jgi:hypothetical protein